MSTTKTESGRRQDQAREALRAVGTARSENQALSLQCRAAHHVATVYRTDAGLVYVARTGARDARGGTEYLDFVVTASGADDLPAWCDCGSRRISRREILQLIREGRRTVRLT